MVPEQERIEKIIQEHHAQDYIRLKGHVNLQDVYRHYQLFVAASQSEGFGLTLMEAVGSGLGMIGFDVNYGSPTFIKDARNGYLIPINLDRESINDVTDHMATKIIQYFENGPSHPHDLSYEIAEEFKTTHIVEKWEQLIKEVLHD